jgi:uncharacterized protein (TIGR00255 family)
LLVEIKSLNNRFLKTSIKLPDMLSFAEPEIERLVRSELRRGTVSYVLHLRHVADNSVFEINQEVLKNYLTGLRQVVTLHRDKEEMNIDLGALLQAPGVCQAREYSEDEHKWFLDTIKKLTAEALENLRAMRTEEGKSLVKDLQQQCNVIRKSVEATKALVDTVLLNYRSRIEQRTNALLADANLELDEDILAREVALFAERSDINEELSRLESHLGQFEQACQGDGETGRRLDFLTQEMFREANTIASKANDAKISQHVVEIKVAIDRLKEQVQNVE